MKFVMDYDNIPGKGPLMLFRDNGDGTRSLATVEDIRSVRREALEEAAKLAETITFEVQDPITKGILKEPRTIKPLWGEDTAKAIRELIDKEEV